MNYKAIVLLLLCSPVHAAMYKWTDAEGNTHYGERPPNRQQAENIAPPPPRSSTPGNRINDLRSLILKQSEDNDKAKSEAAEKAKIDTSNQENCQKLRQRLTQFKNSPRIREKNKDGEYAFLDDEDRKKQVQEMQQRLAKDCD